MTIHFEKYKHLKNILNISYEGILLNRVLSLDIWRWANEKNNFKRFFIFDFFKYYNLEFEDCEYFATGLAYRKDYLALFNEILLKTKSNFTPCYLNRNNDKWTFSFNNKYSIIKKVLSNLKNTNFSLIKRLSIAAKFCYYVNTIFHIKKIECQSLKKYICHSSFVGIENMLTQYFKQKEVETYTYQHGLVPLFKKNIPVDAINYENLESNFFLCWGKYSFDTYTEFGIDSSRVLITGHPLYNKIASSEMHNGFINCLVLLARRQFNKSNQDLLNLLGKVNQENKYCFHIKLHPSLDCKFYRNIALKYNFKIFEESVSSCIENNDFDFSVSVNTSAYYEMLIGGIPSLRYLDDTFELMYGYGDFFCNSDEFNSILNKIKKELIDGNYFKDIKKMLQYTMGAELDNLKLYV